MKLLPDSNLLKKAAFDTGEKQDNPESPDCSDYATINCLSTRRQLTDDCDSTTPN